MNNINLMKMFLAMGDTTEQTIQERIAYQERIVFATPGIIKPRDWDKLSDEIKLDRLTKMQEI